jgi:hypothetical protein
MLQEYQAPTGGSYALQEERSLLGSVDLLRASDSGDVACQGSLNTQALASLGGLATLAQARRWVTALTLDADGRAPERRWGGCGRRRRV